VTDQLATPPGVNKASIAIADEQPIMNWVDENPILSTGTESHDDGEDAWNVATSRRAKRRRRRSSQEKIGGGSSVVGAVGEPGRAVALSSSTPSRSVGHYKFKKHASTSTSSYAGAAAAAAPTRNNVNP